jgi:hypothetical protein
MKKKKTRKRKRDDIESASSKEVELPTKRAKTSHPVPISREDNEIQVPEIKCDTSLEKNEVYCVEVKLPVHPDFYTKQFIHLSDYPIYEDNLKFFIKKKESIINKFSDRWFSIWNTNIHTGEAKFKVGFSLSSVVSGCPVDAVVSYGCNQDAIFCRKSQDDDLLIGFPCNDNLNLWHSNRHFVCKCKFRFQRNGHPDHVIDVTAVME